ncbi:MAG: leucyl/phenylalanyl-tRNA--protein transferase [Proteobacteria bacterium]|nr:leucyl/phenylalanyl-tRNA--protein transferase [Pseudomonadota bacterium]
MIPPALLLAAYRAGIFPMAEARDDPELFWVEPKRRAVLPLDGFRCSRSLARTLRRGRFEVSCNGDFTGVVAACAAPRATEGGESWISHRIAASYQRLHQLGHAHSIECRADGELVGGLYGVQFAGVFCGESMFSTRPDASKVALAWLVAALRLGGTRLLDCQFLTPHLASLGAVEITQKAYLKLLEAACSEESAFGARPLVAGGASPAHSPGPATQSLPGKASGPEERPDNAAGSGANHQSGGGAGSAGLGAGAGVAAAAAAVLALPAAFAALLAGAKSFGSSSSPGNFIAQSFTQTS